MSAGNGNGSTARKPVVLDTDPGIDDAFAMLYLAAAPEVEIVAVGAVHGNITAETAAGNALRLLDLAGLTGVPVAVGARSPLNQPLRTSHAHGEDGLGGVAGPAPARGPVAGSAAEQLVRLARLHPRELTVLALGPLTNLAVALLLDPELPALLRGIVWMGGAVDRPGNITPHAEANARNDPEAADLVLGAGFALTMVPLDATMSARADRAWVAAIAKSEQPRAQFATRLLKHYVDFYSATMGLEGCLLHDPLAAAILVDPALATTSEENQVAVELSGTHTRGMTVTDRRPYRRRSSYDRKPVRIVLAADTSHMLNRMHYALIDAEQQP